MVHITYEQLPEAREWKVGKKYHVKMALKQVSMGEKGADFEVVDATSMEGRAHRSKRFLSGEGSYFG